MNKKKDWMVLTHGNNSDSLLTVKEVAAIIKVSPQAIYRWVDIGAIPHVRLGGNTIRFKLEAIRRWVDNGTVQKKNHKGN